MPQIADRVQETTTTTGTGTLTLAGAVSGYRSFNSSFTNGDIVYYTIDDGSGNWEIGYGTVGTGTLSRTAVLESSNANSLVSFGAGSKRVFCSAPTKVMLPNQTSNSGKVLTTDGTTPSWATSTSGTVTAVSVTSANGFAGTSSGGATPALTLSTTVTGLVKGNGTALSAATSGTDYAPATSGTSILKGSGTGGFSNAASGTDYAPATSGTSILYGNGSGGFSNVTVGAGLSFSGGTLTNTGAATNAISQANSNVTVTDTGTNGLITLTTDGTERARVDQYGNLLVGATSITPAWASSAQYGGIMQLTQTDYANSYSVYLSKTGDVLGLFGTYDNGNGTGGIFIDSYSENPAVTSYQEIVITGNPVLLRGGTSAYPGSIRLNTAGVERLRVTEDGNIGIGTSTFGTSAAKILSIATGTAPTTGPADTVQFYSSDLSAGNTIPSFYCEGSGIVTGNTTAAATHRIAIRINGTIYYFLANTSA